MDPKTLHVLCILKHKMHHHHLRVRLILKRDNMHLNKKVLSKDNHQGPFQVLVAKLKVMCQVVGQAAPQVLSTHLPPPQATKYLNIGQAVHPFTLTPLMHRLDVIAYQTLVDHPQQLILGTEAFVQELLALDQV